MTNNYTLKGAPLSWAFPNLWFAKPVVCMRVAFHGNDGNLENNEDDSDSPKQRVECWISGNHGNHGHDENHGLRGANHELTTNGPRNLEIPE